MYKWKREGKKNARWNWTFVANGAILEVINPEPRARAIGKPGPVAVVEVEIEGVLEASPQKEE